MKLVVLTLCLSVGIGCKQQATCVEGASTACVCPSGAAGAQSCNAKGAYEPCVCGQPPTTDAGSNCDLPGLRCSRFDSQGQSGWKLHKLVFEARAANRNDEAICLAQQSMHSTDAVLVGASHFEASQAWSSLGCHDNAVLDVDASLASRPVGEKGWSETCELCKKLGADCKRCDATTREIIEDDLIGHWRGSVVTTIRDPANYTTGTKASVKVTTAVEEFEIVRRDGKLLTIEGKFTSLPMKLVRERGGFADRAQDDVSLNRYWLDPAGLKIENEMKGHFGGNSVGVFKRVP